MLKPAKSHSKELMHPNLRACFAFLAALLLPSKGVADPIRLQRQTNGDLLLQLAAPSGQHVRFDASTDLAEWQPLATVRSNGTIAHTDSAARFFAQRFYRAIELSETPNLTGDHLVTNDDEVIIHPVDHASFVMGWSGRMIYNDPVGASTRYSGFAKADLILVSHGHSDHYSNSTLEAVRGPNVRIIAPQAVFNSMTAALKAVTTVLANGASTNVIDLTVEAVPAYNSNHPRGEGNGYVVTLSGKRIYISGDTGNTPEMRALQNIDVAFLCMNVPFTMSVADAVTAVRAFRPRVVYPYHYRNQNGTFADLNSFQNQVSSEFGVEVRARTWYGATATLLPAEPTRPVDDTRRRKVRRSAD